MHNLKDAMNYVNQMMDPRDAADRLTELDFLFQTFIACKAVNINKLIDIIENEPDEDKKWLFKLSAYKLIEIKLQQIIAAQSLTIH